MVSRREEVAYKYPRTRSGEKCYFSLHKKEKKSIQFIFTPTIQLGGTTEEKLIDLSKDISKCLLLKETQISAEYLPVILNARADSQPRHSMDFSEWKLSAIVFQHIY